MAIGNCTQAFEWYRFDLSDLFKVTNHDYSMSNTVTRKWYRIQLCLQWLTNRKSYMIYQMAPFSMILNDFYLRFKVTPFFGAEYLRNSMRYRHSFNEILIGTYTRPAQQ